MDSDGDDDELVAQVLSDDDEPVAEVSSDGDDDESIAQVSSDGDDDEAVAQVSSDDDDDDDYSAANYQDRLNKEADKIRHGTSFNVQLAILKKLKISRFEPVSIKESMLQGATFTTRKRAMRFIEYAKSTGLFKSTFGKYFHCALYPIGEKSEGHYVVCFGLSYPPKETPSAETTQNFVDFYKAEQAKFFGENTPTLTEEDNAEIEKTVAQAASNIIKNGHKALTSMLKFLTRVAPKGEASADSEWGKIAGFAGIKHRDFKAALAWKDYQFKDKTRPGIVFRKLSGVPLACQAIHDLKGDEALMCFSLTALEKKGVNNRATVKALVFFIKLQAKLQMYRTAQYTKAPSVEAKEDKSANPSETLSDDEMKHSIDRRIRAVFSELEPDTQTGVRNLFHDRHGQKDYVIARSNDGAFGYSFNKSDKAHYAKRFLVFADKHFKAAHPDIIKLSDLLQPQIVEAIVEGKPVHWLYFELADKNKDDKGIVDAVATAQAQHALGALGTMWVSMPSSMPNVMNVTPDHAAAMQSIADTLLKELNKKSKDELRALLCMLLSWTWKEISGQFGCQFLEVHTRDKAFKKLEKGLKTINHPTLTDALVTKRLINTKGHSKKPAIHAWLQVGSDLNDKTPTSKPPEKIVLFLNCLINAFGKAHHIERPAVDWPKDLSLSPSKKGAAAAAASAPTAPSKKKKGAAAAAASAPAAPSKKKKDTAAAAAASATAAPTKKKKSTAAASAAAPPSKKKAAESKASPSAQPAALPASAQTSSPKELKKVLAIKGQADKNHEVKAAAPAAALATAVAGDSKRTGGTTTILKSLAAAPSRVGAVPVPVVAKIPASLAAAGTGAAAEIEDSRRRSDPSHQATLRPPAAATTAARPGLFNPQTVTNAPTAATGNKHRAPS